MSRGRPKKTVDNSRKGLLDYAFIYLDHAMEVYEISLYIQPIFADRFYEIRKIWRVSTGENVSLGSFSVKNQKEISNLCAKWSKKCIKEWFDDQMEDTVDKRRDTLSAKNKTNS